MVHVGVGAGAGAVVVVVVPLVEPLVLEEVVTELEVLDFA